MCCAVTCFSKSFPSRNDVALSEAPTAKAAPVTRAHPFQRKGNFGDIFKGVVIALKQKQSLVGHSHGRFERGNKRTVAARLNLRNTLLNTRRQHGRTRTSRPHLYQVPRQGKLPNSTVDP